MFKKLEKAHALAVALLTQAGLLVEANRVTISYRVQGCVSLPECSSDYEAEAQFGAAYGYQTFRGWGITPKQAARHLAQVAAEGAEAARRSPLAQLLTASSATAQPAVRNA